MARSSIFNLISEEEFEGGKSAVNTDKGNKVLQ